MSRFPLVVVVALSLLVGVLRPVAAEGPTTFGTAAEVAHVVGGSEFNPYFGNGQDSTYGERRCTGGPCGFFASLRLPSGAVVHRIELDACDSNGAGDVQYAMFRAPSPATPASNTNLTGSFFATTGISETPGCALFTQPLTTPVTIDNRASNYFLQVDLSTGATDLTFWAVRVFYTLQVSPAPATATFGDVPISHPFFPFIEALVASGITAGCGGGNYCPDAPLTRGQMAVFLGKALGLHFTP
jgi:hypothetical protein